MYQDWRPTFLNNKLKNHVMDKIKFQSGSSSPFFKAVDKEVNEMMTATGLLKKAKRLLYIKTLFYVLLFAASYFALFIFAHSSFLSLVIIYIMTGLSGFFLPFTFFLV